MVSVYHDSITTVLGELTRVGNCVGERNYRYFVGFLSTILILVFVVAATAIFSSESVASQCGLWDTSISLFNDTIIIGPNYLTVTFLIPECDFWLAYLILIPTSTFVAITILLSYHFWLIKNGITTNENVKLNHTLDDIDDQLDAYLRDCVDRAFELTEKEFQAIKKKMMAKEKQIEKVLTSFESEGFAINAQSMLCRPSSI